MAGFLVIALVTAGAALRWRRARVAGVDVESEGTESELAAER